MYPTSIEGNANLVEQFSEVYGNLYSSVQDSVEIDDLLLSINEKNNNDLLIDADLVTAEVLLNAVKQIKASKTDPVLNFNSDCVKNAGPLLYVHLANIIKCFLIHGYVRDLLLVATIIPLIKDKLGDPENSDDYRSIALNSVVLNVFDWIIITLFGNRLGLDKLLFSYQKHCSTTMCTWLVLEPPFTK